MSTVGLAHRGSRYSDVELWAELRRVADLTADAVLSERQFRTLATVSVATYLRRYGSWRQALGAAGLSHRYSGRTVSAKMRAQTARRLTNDQLLVELRRIADHSGRPYVTGHDLRAGSPVNKSAFVYRFGSWPAALAAAGLIVAPRGKHYTDDDLAANLRTVINVYGRTPRLSELDRSPSTVTSGTYRNRYGTLEQARRTLDV